MARSRRIYVVEHPHPVNCDPPHVVAAFTVKHELITWLSRQMDHPYYSEWNVYAVGDGWSQQPGETKCMSREIFEAAEAEAQT